MMGNEVREGYKEVRIRAKKYQFPKNWDIVKLEDCCEICYGKAQGDVVDDNGEYPILGTGGVIGYANDYLFDAPSVLIGRKGTIDEPKFIDEPFWTIDTLFYTDIYENTVPKFLYYYLNYYDLNLLNEATGVPSLNRKNLYNLDIPLPQLSEQKKVTTILSSVDKAIEKIDEIIEETKKLKKGLMQGLLTKGIGHTEFKEVRLGVKSYEIPRGWRLVKFEELLGEQIISKIQDGNHGSSHPRSSDFQNNGVPFITSDCISKGKLELNKAKKIPEDYLDNLRIGFSKPGDVLLSHKGSIGYTAIVPDNVNLIILSPQITYYRIKDYNLLDNLYLKYAFDSYYFQTRMKTLSPQSTRDYIGITAQQKLQILLPPLEEQKKIAKILSSVDNKIQKKKEYKESLEQLKKGLMQKLLTGEIRV